jgi:hypothetical protein
VPAGHVTRAELDRLIAQDSVEAMATLLLEAKQYVFPDGHTKVRDLVERLRDLDDMDERQAAKLIEAVISYGHLLLRPEDEKGGFFSLPNRWRILGLVSNLMERMDKPKKQELMMKLANSSPGLWGLVGLADIIFESRSEPSKATKAFVDLDDSFPDGLVSAVAKRLDGASLEQLLSMPELDYIVSRWGKWSDPARIRADFRPLVDDDDQLPTLLEKFVRTGVRQSGNRVDELYQISMTSLSVVMDIRENSERVLSLKSRDDLNLRQQKAVDLYARGLQRIEEGKDPDGFYLEDHS